MARRSTLCNALVLMLTACGSPNPSPPQEVAAPADPLPPQQTAARASAQVTSAELDLVVRQILRCWSPPIEARGARDIVVEIVAQMSPEGRVMAATVISTARMGEPAYRAVAESAWRAILNPQCSPLALPAEKYEQWKTLQIRFNPRDAL